jgi:hypothetical protein
MMLPPPGNCNAARVHTVGGGIVVRTPVDWSFK